MSTRFVKKDNVVLVGVAKNGSQAIKQISLQNDGFEVREQAFNYLLQINAYNDVAIKHLILATKHHNWRFKKDAERILNILKKDEKYSELVNTYLVE